MNEGLTDDQVALRATVREVAEGEIAPVAEELDREGRFPYGIVPRPVWAATVTATEESTRASSSMAIA